MTLVIGLIGAKGAGKTTAFQTIASAFTAQEITLAGKLKDVCAEVFNIPRDHFDAAGIKEKELEDPIFLQGPQILRIFNSYADVIKDVVPYDQFMRPHVGKVLYSPRKIAQYIGTEVLRNYMPAIHCEAAARSVTEPFAVVTDLRFPNEFEFFQTRFGQNFIPVYVANMAAEVSAAKDPHPSEAHMKDLAKKATYTLDNNGALHDFKASVANLMVDILHY